MDVIARGDGRFPSFESTIDTVVDTGLPMPVIHRPAFLLDVAQESAQLAGDLLREARLELAREECDPGADDLTIAIARQRAHLARQRLRDARRTLGFEHDHGCECC
jgi:hypothetical protein